MAILLRSMRHLPQRLLPSKPTINKIKPACRSVFLRQAGSFACQLYSGTQTNTAWTKIM